MRATDAITAALLVIGEEILSGRTADQNIAYVARFLGQAGIQLREVRVVPDVEDEIVAAVNALRPRYRYVFTTGGIGPTHDDITTDAIGRAFGVTVIDDPRALAVLRARYSEGGLNEARARMARIPEGAALINNPISGAPGYMIENVIVMAGVPRVMHVMLDEVIERLDKGRRVASRAVRIDVLEGDVAPGLTALATAYPDVQMGSYPFFEQGRVGTYVVLRSTDPDRLDHALGGLWTMIAHEGFPAVSASENGTATEAK